MELFIYDREMVLLGVVDEIKALVWTRRYWACGEFALLLPHTAQHAELIRHGRYIAHKDADEAGQIRYIHVSRDANGLEQIEAKGLFLTHWIGKRMLLSRLQMTAPTQDILRHIVRENLVAPADPRRVIPNLRIDETALPDIETVTCNAEAYENALDVCAGRAKLAKIGFKIITDLRAGNHCFAVYKGLDRTSGQRVNPPCIFSPDFDTVLTQEYTHSVENVASAIYVEGEAQEGAPRPVVEVADDARTGLDRVEFLYNATDVRRSTMVDGEEQRLSDEAYATLLKAQGERTLAGKIEHLAFSSLINTRAHLRYKQDFDLGDRVTCINQRWKIRIEVRITEIVESYESGKADLEITFGESLPTISAALKWR